MRTSRFIQYKYQPLVWAKCIVNWEWLLINIGLWQHLGKRTRYGMSSDVAWMFNSFLSSRIRITCVGNDWSDEIELKYVISQSSILGPLNFISTLNNLPSYVRGSLVNTQPELYADSTTFSKIFCEFESIPNLTKNTLNPNFNLV